MSNAHEFILTLACEDRPGIVASVSTWLADRGCTIADSQQFGDPSSHRFFMRVVFEDLTRSAIEAAFQDDFRWVAEEWGMDFQLRASDRVNRMLIMVSREGHCLNDLLHRVRTGAIPASIEAVVSNHETFRSLVEWHDIPFHFVPVTPDTKAEAEAELLRLVAAHEVETVVLARYMQILSDGLCKELEGRAINIHHSLLPAFKGAKPYDRAHARGVKVVGATAHYVTADLDEGPIIEQDFERVTHRLGAAHLAALGRDIEARALARAVHAHVEQRVLLNGDRTVIF